MSLATFIRRADEVEYARELVVGQWGMIPPWSKTKVPTTARGARLSTVNARTEGMEKSPTYKDALARGKRCIVPAASFDEPNWELGKTSGGASAAPMVRRGAWRLWNTWIDNEAGEVWDNYTMLTLNADGHPLMGRMHKPDPKLAPDQQDKRSVIPLAVHECDLWLAGTVEGKDAAEARPCGAV